MKLCVLPIRYWETDELDEVIVEEAYPDGFIYGMSKAYGHNVYFRSEKCFRTPELAQAEIARLRYRKDEEEEVELSRIMDNIFGRVKAGETPRAAIIDSILGDD